jgi:hypothetical protein
MVVHSRGSVISSKRFLGLKTVPRLQKLRRVAPKWNNARSMAWFVWLLIVVALLTVVFVAIGRSLQKKGRDVERHRD